jgi:hypothetical protein
VVSDHWTLKPLSRFGASRQLGAIKPTMGVLSHAQTLANPYERDPTSPPRCKQHQEISLFLEDPARGMSSQEH